MWEMWETSQGMWEPSIPYHHHLITLLTRTTSHTYHPSRLKLQHAQRTHAHTQNHTHEITRKITRTRTGAGPAEQLLRGPDAVGDGDVRKVQPGAHGTLRALALCVYFNA